MQTQPETDDGIAADAALPLNREDFFNQMIGTLCGTIEDVVGMADAEGFIGIVGRQIGNSTAARVDIAAEVSTERIAHHLRDFKHRIGGGFQIEEIAGDRITFTNCRCPFAEQAAGRPSLCMMTTNVFGRIAANATGYARVNVVESLARGDSRCLVTVKLSRSDLDDGLEFFA